MSLIIFATLLMLAVQSYVLLLASSTSNTILTYPEGYTVIEDQQHNEHLSYHNQLYTKYGARWLAYGHRSRIILESRFYADCTKPVKVMIAVKGGQFQFQIIVNNKETIQFLNKHPPPQVFNFQFQKQINCGINVLKVDIAGGAEPVCAIYVVVQEQADCFTCLTPLAFYSKKTCKCQCINGCNCTSNNQSPLMKWYDYPTCGCKCKSSPQKCSTLKQWGETTCRCQCKQIYCFPGYQQHSTQCYCKKICPEGTPKVCPQGKYPDEVKCKCMCKMVQYCPSGKINQDTCQCIYEFKERPEWL